MAGASIIDEEQFMLPMLDACPSFSPKWQSFVEEWDCSRSSNAEGMNVRMPHYLLLSDFADHLVKMLEGGETDRFDDVFAVLEAWITRGDHYVSEAAVVGLIEELIRVDRYTTAQPNDFLPWLHSTSRKWWFEVIDFWDRMQNGNFRPLSID